MSSGVYRKQYEALAALAANLGIDFNTPEGSFNEKFCELCRIMIVDSGGAFSPVTGGSFLTRKAVYLRQLATALTLSPSSGTSMRETFLKAALSIWTAYGDEDPDYGAAYDWRVYQYLLYSTNVGPALSEDLLQRLFEYNGVDPFGDSVDPRLSSPEVTGVNCLSFDGTDKQIAIPQQTLGDSFTYRSRMILRSADYGTVFFGGDVISHEGTLCIIRDIGTFMLRTGDTSGSNYTQVQGSITTFASSFDDKFHDVVITYDRQDSNRLTLTVDGVEWKNLTTWSNGNLTPRPDAIVDRLFWTVGGGVAPRFYDGLASEVSIENEDGVLLKYPLQEGSGTVAHDVSGNGNHGTINDATWSQTEGTSLSFDNEVFAASVTLPSVPDALSATGIFEIETDLLISDSETSFQRIMWFVDGGSGFFRLQKVSGANTYQLWCRSATGDDIYNSGNVAFTPNVMYNLRITGDGTNVVMRHDGVVVKTMAITTGNLGAISYTEATLSSTAQSYDMVGKLSNFKMTGGTTLHTQYPFSEGSGTVAHDISGNGNHGTITGATWVDGESIPSWNLAEGFSTLTEITRDSSFDDPSQWELSLGWTMADSKLTKTGIDTSGFSQKYEAPPLINGVTYRVTVEVNRTSASGSIYKSGSSFEENSITIGTDGTIVNDMLCVNNNNPLKLVAVGGWQGTVSRISMVPLDAPALWYPALAEPTLSQLTFDGASDIVRSELFAPPTEMLSDIEVEITFTPSDTDGTQVLGGLGKDPWGGSLFLPYLSGSTVHISINVSGGIQRRSLGYNVEAGKTYKTKFTYNGELLKLFVDGTEEYSGSVYPASGPLTPQYVNYYLSAGAGAVYNTTTAYYPFAGAIRHVKLKDGPEYDFTKYLGRYTEVISDESGNGNDGTISTSSGLSTMWGTRFADSGGTEVDAGSYLPLTNRGGDIYNGAEPLAIQTAVATAFGGPTYWGTGEVWVPKDYDAALNHPNGSGGSWLKWEQDAVSGVWYVAKADQYPAGMNFTPAQVSQNERYYGESPVGGFGALRYVSGDFMLDVDGYVLFIS